MSLLVIDIGIYTKERTFESRHTHARTDARTYTHTRREREKTRCEM